MIIVLAGASGSGKTTLAKEVAQRLNWQFKENSAGLILENERKEVMKERWGYNGNAGQQGVISLSHKKPSFGLYFQESIRDAREAMLSKLNLEGNYIFDRGPLDPIVYYLNQCSEYHTPDFSEQFILSCMKSLRYVDKVIRVPLQNPTKTIEDNGSRIANWYFQKKIDALFDKAMELVQDLNKEYPYTLDGHTVGGFKLSEWDFENRVRAVKHIINNH